MIKFKISGERIAEACNIIEFLGLQAKSRPAIIRVAPRFILEDNDYIVKVILDEDGDIKEFVGLDVAMARMTGVTPKRLEKLIDEFGEAAKTIVNPQSGGGLNGQSSTVTEKPPPG